MSAWSKAKRGGRFKENQPTAAASSAASGLTSRIALGVAGGDKLFELAGAQSGLLGKLAPCRRIERFVDIHEPARQRPDAGERLMLPLDKQDAPLRLMRHDHDVNRHRRAGIGVRVFFPGHGSRLLVKAASCKLEYYGFHGRLFAPGATVS
jgi:hypothetical protein